MGEILRCINCPAAEIDAEDISCKIYEDQRELGNSHEYGCSRRSIEKIKKDIKKQLNEEIKALEEMYYS